LGRLGQFGADLTLGSSKRQRREAGRLEKRRRFPPPSVSGPHQSGPRSSNRTGEERMQDGRQRHPSTRVAQREAALDRLRVSLNMLSYRGDGLCRI
jgi:hypothetical protein